MKKKKIYRVVDENGSGYKEKLDSILNNFTEMNTSSLCAYLNLDYSIMRPMPNQDGIETSKLTKEHLFAFFSPGELQSWFTPAEQSLGAKVGAKIQVFEIDIASLLIGGRQIAFRSSDAVLLYEIPMDYFLSDAQKVSAYDFEKCYREIFMSEDSHLLSIDEPQQLRDLYC